MPTIYTPPQKSQQIMRVVCLGCHAVHGSGARQRRSHRRAPPGAVPRALHRRLRAQGGARAPAAAVPGGVPRGVLAP
eukprot:1195851-Prorocentrum_minimum.AAC.25